MTITREEAEELDAADPLARLRTEFDLPEGVIYLDGNSLGPPPRQALARLEDTASKEWRQGLIRSWNDAGWFDLPKRAGAKIAQLIGAAPSDVIIADSVSVNLFKVAAALIARKRAPIIAIEANEFPTDAYILEGLAGLTGARLTRIAAGAPIPAGLDALVKSLVHYRTGAVADLRAVEKQATVKGASVIWDLSHAVGLLDINLTRDGARYAVGCGYKFLNGGPGAPAFVYVAEKAANVHSQPLSGWMGHVAPFDFAPDYRPARGVARFAAGTPPILSLAALDAALDLFEGVNLADVEAKARALGDLFLKCCAPLGLETISPPVGARRGAQASFIHENGFEIMQALIARGVIGDFRAPNIMRFGFSPLFLSYVQVFDAATALADVVRNETWRAPEYSRRGAVT